VTGKKAPIYLKWRFLQVLANFECVPTNFFADVIM